MARLVMSDRSTSSVGMPLYLNLKLGGREAKYEIRNARAARARGGISKSAAACGAWGSPGAMCEAEVGGGVWLRLWRRRLLLLLLLLLDGYAAGVSST